MDFVSVIVLIVVAIPCFLGLKRIVDTFKSDRSGGCCGGSGGCGDPRCPCGEGAGGVRLKSVKPERGEEECPFCRNKASEERKRG